MKKIYEKYMKFHEYHEFHTYCFRLRRFPVDPENLTSWFLLAFLMLWPHAGVLRCPHPTPSPTHPSRRRTFANPARSVVYLLTLA